MLPIGDLIVIVRNIRNGGLSGDDGDLGEAVIVRVKRLVMQRTVEIIPDYMHLVKPTPEGLGGREVADVAEPEDVGVLLVAQSVDVYVKQSVSLWTGKPGVLQALMRLAGND